VPAIPGRLTGHARRGLLALAGIAVLSPGLAACGEEEGPAGAEIKGDTLTIYSSLPLQGPLAAQARAINQGAALALQNARGRVGRRKVRFVTLDDSSAAAGGADRVRIVADARRAASDSTTIAYLGEYSSEATAVSLPTLNQKSIPQVSPSPATTHVGLTTTLPGSEDGEPRRYYPLGIRHYVRLVPNDAVQGIALANAMKEDGCRAVHIWHGTTTYGEGLAENVKEAAEEVELRVTGNDESDARARGRQPRTGAIRANCFLYAGEGTADGIRALEAVAAAKPRIRLYAGDRLLPERPEDRAVPLSPAAAGRLKVTRAPLDPAYVPPAGKQFFAEFRRAYSVASPPVDAIYGYEAMALVLNAIKRSGDEVSRKRVIEELLSTSGRQSVLGKYSIDENGDTTLKDYGVYRIRGGRPVFERVVKAET
jgi:branched-chain amino acid transport system substrate-binding protein